MSESSYCPMIFRIVTSCSSEVITNSSYYVSGFGDIGKQYAPGNIRLFLVGDFTFRHSSARMHPSDHMSTYVSWNLESNITSGERYHLLYTWVETLLLWVFLRGTFRDNPKSHNFTWQSELIRMLAGLISLCMMLAEWSMLRLQIKLYAIITIFSSQIMTFY